MVKSILLMFLAASAAGYEKSNALKSHNHSTAAGDGGQLSSPVILGTPTVQGVTVGTAGSTLTVTATGIAFPDGSVQTKASSLTGNAAATISTANITQQLDVVGAATFHSSTTIGNTWTLSGSTLQAPAGAFVDFTSASVHTLLADITTMTYSGISSPAAIPLVNNVVNPWSTGFIDILIVGTGGSLAGTVSITFSDDTSEAFTATCNLSGAAQAVNFNTSASSIPVTEQACAWSGASQLSAHVFLGHNGTSNNIMGYIDSVYSANGGVVLAQGSHTTFTATRAAGMPKFLMFRWSGGGTANVFAKVYYSNL